MNFCWDMALNGKALVVPGYILICFLLVLLSGRVCHATPNDIECLKSTKASLGDPYNYLSSWNFNNSTEGFICKFTGVDCWHPDENKVLNIRLSDMGLKGDFPRGIEKCESLTGPIPPSLANCSFLNVLELGNNRLTGEIPLQLGVLNRIKTFNVANNLLSGPIPDFGPNITIQADSYANNPGLCGKILQSCPAIPTKSRVGIIAASAVGGVTFTAIIVGIILFYFSRGPAMNKEEDDPEGNKWAKTIKGKKGIKVSMFEESVSKMRLSDLMKATNEFSKSNVIGMGRTGTMYKAMLPDGYCLMIKRLEDFQRLEKEFASEMNTLGSVKHRNLVPLLGFCVAKERFLVYKYMENGTLYDKLHPAEPEVRNMDWPLRLRIGIGAARGLAWLHHNCNPRIIHRNISSKCILLDGDFEPKLSDFGLARLMNPIDTHLSTFVNGEFGDLGYVAPEYPRTLVATPKGDIYSFGVVLLELVTGEKPTHVVNAPERFRGSLAEWITELSSSSLLQTAIDKSLLGNGFDSEVMQFLRVACNCVLPTPKERPTMFEVFQLLRAIGERYHFTTEDEIMLPSNSNNTDVPELIVAQEAKWV
ncbi:probably inactive leucine-rich repeat receptor-like protein kinase At5g48380 isoform X2 [Herrania umbratica]|uniref:Probably inactive leucine-rich repeat receptor-like protein kinase At5g48380 isoform X2 n=1 Tax=Herrania umbratica TaxID=108875 RepID=A0A6J1AQ14_9ROSI|nr:probably inactive leucine-rich repeat receptor-like protein kinase At5g48380 isoform X2 [Herrania umbratica]